jgi:putative ABC transport system permease protein
MILFLKVFFESIRQARHSLVANKLRTFLSLVGITIGIFAIVAVRSAVDSLQANVMEGISELGSDVVYVEKWPWNAVNENNYWKFMKRPEVSLEDYQIIREQSKKTDHCAFMVSTGSGTINYRSSSVSGSFLLGSTYEYQDIQKLDIERGRYFTPQESREGLNKVILGYSIAKSLFPRAEALGKEIKMRGRKFTVIGVLKEEGESMFNFINFDEIAWIPLNTARKFINIKGSGIQRSLAIKPYEDVEMDELKSELTGILRASRRLKPKEENDFSLMEMSSLNQSLDGLFSTLNLAGFVIGIFALIVGMFSVANIMFVSVKERTNQIGIKMAIGAKKHVILWEFLIEGIILCVLGGLMGLVFVYGIVVVVSSLTPFNMVLSLGNIIYGIVWSIIIGLVAAIIPALQASRLDPVVAIRK